MCMYWKMQVSTNVQKREETHLCDLSRLCKIHKTDLEAPMYLPDTFFDQILLQR